MDRLQTIQQDLAKYFPHIAYLSHISDQTKSTQLSQKELINQIKLDSAHWAQLNKASKLKLDTKLNTDANGPPIANSIKSIESIQSKPDIKDWKDKTNKKNMKVDWLSDQYSQEFKALAISENKDHQMLVKLYRLLKIYKDTPKETQVITQLESLGLKATQYQKTQEALKSLAPKLTLKINELKVFKKKLKYRGN
jgi:hypothetical protein